MFASKTVLLSRIFIFLGIFMMSSCAYYRQDIILKVKDKDQYYFEGPQEERFVKEYQLQPYDYFDFKIFTNKGEVLIDPTGKLQQIQGYGNKGADFQNAGGGGGRTVAQQMPQGYQIDGQGKAWLPLAGEELIAGYTKLELDSVLSKIYSAYYDTNLYIKSHVLNKYVYFIRAGGRRQGGSAGGAGGRGGSFITLPRENMSVMEVVAMAGGIPQHAKADKIRVLRGSADDYSLYIVNLSTLESLERTNINVKAYDIIYIEPGRRAFFDGLRDFQTITSLTLSTISVITTTFLILSNSN